MRTSSGRALTVLCLVVVIGVRTTGVELYQRSCALVCAKPQPRSIRIEELIDTKYEIRPYMTVLYRCDEGTGCCNRGKTCQVKNFDDLEVRLPTFIDGKYVFINYTISNHTECSCQNRKNDIKR